MIKPILLLLFAAAGLALLDQTNGMQTRGDPSKEELCPSFWFECKGAVNKAALKTYAKICVPFKRSSRGKCNPNLTIDQIREQCEQAIPEDYSPGFSYVTALRSEVQCSIGQREGLNGSRFD